jgi:dTDP-4-amino-4,6-dideoxygalactose transaminase
MSDVSFLDLGFTYRALQAELDEAVSRSLRSGWYILGPEVEAFEGEFASYVGAEHCVGLANGLDALTLCLRAWQIGPGDEVVVPSNTYIATWLAVSAVGATPVPVEPTTDGFNLDPARVAEALTPRTRVILPVHLYGEAAELAPLLELAQARGIRVLDDAAQAHGSVYRGRKVGGIADASAWSFYPSKNLGAFGDGGAVTTNDAKLAERLRLLRNYGSRKKYENELLGVNSRLDPIQAAILSVKLRHLDAWNDQRRRFAQAYHQGLAGLSWLKLPAPSQDSVWHVYVVRVEERQRFQEHLASAGVQTLIHYPIPAHRQPAYASQFGAASYPLCEAIHRTVVSLPMGPHLTQVDVERVITAVRAFQPSAT